MSLRHDIVGYLEHTTTRRDAVECFASFTKRFHDESACLSFLFETRHIGSTCPKCGRQGQYHRQVGRPRYTCACGQHHIYPRVGTVLSQSNVPVVKWFLATFLVWATNGNVASRKLAELTGMSYSAAWRIRKSIRARLSAEEWPPNAEDAVLRCIELPKSGIG